MYIGLRNIQNHFSDYRTLLTSSDSIHCLTGWNRLSDSPTPYRNHLLYVCEYNENLKGFSFGEDMHILCIVNTECALESLAEQFPAEVRMLFIACDEPDMVYSRLQTYFNTQCSAGFFGQTLLEFLAFDNGLQSAIDYSFRAFGNPVFVFDANFNLIAATWEEIEKSGLSDSLVLNKRLTEEDFRMINRRNHIHEKVKKSEIPIRAYNEFLGYEQMYCAINTQKNLGHIVISATVKPFEPIDEDMLLILKKYVDHQLRKDAFIRTSRGFNYEYFMKDLLEGKITGENSFMARMNSVDREFFGNMYCMVIETARSADTINESHVRNMMESRFPNTKAIILNGQIIGIICVPGNQLLSEEYIEKGIAFCKENDLYAGLSNCFENILNLSEYYNQSLRAIELGNSSVQKAGMYIYSDYYMKHITNIFRQKAQPEVFSHPKMKLLLDYDARHHSELAYTMYMYLLYERNLSATSEAMYMHRTSLIYRFKKIHALIGENFDDPNERMYMILSYEMLKD